VAFRVSTVLGQDGAQQRVVMVGDHADMIRRGLEGSAMAVDGRVDGRVPGEIGSVETITDGPAAQVRVRLFDPRTPLVPGDLILLPAAIHWETPPSVFLSLARAGIGFLPQRQGDTFLGTISTNRQLDIPDPRLATAELARAVRTAAFELRSGTIAVPPELTGPLPAGRFGGVTALEAMERTTPADALACLHWLDRHPEGFMGHSWDFADVYATWLVTGAPE